nr:hypothetical protein KPHV_84700 [Kitasatospora purpeofusca]
MAVPPEIDHDVIAALFQFRMATAEQLRVLHSPDAGLEQMRKRLRRFRDEGLVEAVVLPQAGKQMAWYLTEHAVRIAATFPELEGVASPPLPEDKTAARLRVGHVLAVVRTHVAFVAGARQVGDECAPLDFLPEVYHRFGEGRDGAVIPDGLLHYATKGPDRRLHRAFVEVDRGTMASEKLAAKLIGYARFHEHHPIPAPCGAPPTRRACSRPGSSTARPSRGCCSSWPTPASGPPASGCATCRPLPTATRWSPEC